MMSYNRHNALSGFPTDERQYLNQQLMDLFPVNKEAELNSLAGNWAYDRTMDLFSLTPVVMDPVSYQFPDGLASTDTEGLFVDQFADSTSFDGVTIELAEDATSVSSSDLDSDDRPWSTSPDQYFDTRRAPPHSTASSRWFSSPEIQPQNPISQQPNNRTTSRPARKTHTLSQDSDHSSASQDQQIRNTAKRAAHNVIEKRYRTNMNTRFLALEGAISPGSSQKRSSSTGAESLKKSKILTNALAYIETVRQENEALREELARANQRFVSDSVS